MKKRAHMTFDIPEDMRIEIKLAAIRRRMTMRAWLWAVIAEAIRKENELNS